jgi:hypothetical protein
LVAGIAAVGMIASISIFAAAPDRIHQDEVTITNIGPNQQPKDGVTVTQDFGFGYSFKPHAGLKQYNLRVTIDGRPVENRRHHNESGWSGMKGFHYTFRYGMNEARTGRTNGFDWNLLKPGNHTLVVRACNNNAPSTGCKDRAGEPGQLDRKQISFKIGGEGRDAITTGMQGPITVHNAKTLGESHIKDATDTRLRAGSPASDPAEESTDIETVESDLLPEEVTGENAGGTDGFDEEFEIAALDTIIANSLVGTVRANHVKGTHPIQVWVNPRGLSPGHVTVQIYGGACNENVKVVGSGGDAVFGGCPNGHGYTAAVHQDQFTNGNQHCTVAGSKTAGVGGDNQANLHYNCNPINPPGPQPPPGPVPGGTHQISVSLHGNVDPKTINVPVTAFGGYCNNQSGRASNHVVKHTDGNGGVTFGGCTGGSKHSVSIPASAATSDGTPCTADNGTQRDINQLNGDWNPTFHYQCGSGGGGGGGGDVVKNRAPWIALTALGSQAAFVDVFKLGAGKDINVGQVKEVRAVVDGRVVDSHAPPEPKVEGKGYKSWPTIKHERLNLGHIADGKAHEIKLQAISTRGVPAEITINVLAEKSVDPVDPGPESEPDPDVSLGAITATVYEDVDGNGERDEGEPGLEDVDVLVEPSGEQTVEPITIRTDAQGGATAEELPDGPYVVAADTPDGFTASAPEVQEVDVEGGTAETTFGKAPDDDFEDSEPNPDAPGDPLSDAPSEDDGDQPGSPGDDGTGTGGQGGTQGGGLVGGLGSLPKTGQVGLIAFITFLLASAAYYGTQFYREHKQR